MTGRDLSGLMIVAAALRISYTFRMSVVEPRDWAAACASAGAPFPCLPRQALLWLQYQDLWGVAALALGVWAIVGAPFAVRIAAVAAGVVAVVNFNATFGVLGGALGAWAWLMRVEATRPVART